ncbi:MAG: hypothetical protein AAGA63_14505 [Pseudomonadota bacterium]
MEFEELWSAGLNECLDEGFFRVRALYHRDEDFADMCRDFVDIKSLSDLDLSKDAHVVECLLGLKREIQSHFRIAQRGNNAAKVPSL